MGIPINTHNKYSTNPLLGQLPPPDFPCFFPSLFPFYPLQRRAFPAILQADSCKAKEKHYVPSPLRGKSAATICWHTGADFFSGYPECRESELDWASAFVDGTEANRRLLDGLDHAVPYLKRLQSDGVPILWRPFHEMDGGWFWWGRGGAENFVRLWRLMYDRYTHVHGLRNLIWVLGFSDATADLRPWYPGDDVVDILGGDSYKVGAQGDLYRRCAALAPAGMPIVFHECGQIPTRAERDAAAAPWAYFMVWHTSWLTDSSKGNTPESLRAIYRDSSFVTLHQLPDFIESDE